MALTAGPNHLTKRILGLYRGCYWANGVKGATGSDEQAQHQLGHTSAATTRRFYLTRGTSAGNGAALDGFLSAVYRSEESEMGGTTWAGA